MNGRPRPGPPRGAARIGPTPPDQAGVPAQQGARGDNQAQLTELTAGRHPGQRGQDRPVGPGRPRCPDMSRQNRDLVAREEDLSVLSTVRAGEQGKPAEHAEHR